MADRWDSSLYDDRHSWVWKKVGDLIDLLGPQPGERILDLGCGTGRHRENRRARRQVLGLDGSASMIAQARQNYPKLKFPSLMPAHSSATSRSMPFSRMPRCTGFPKRVQ